MAPSRPGGRPKNAWNSSRRRKLVRLYTLTNLNTAEIGKVLKVNGFSPCLRDIQARLKDLFPSDYAKKSHRYRPSNGSSSAVRLKRLQQHCQARGSRAMRLAKDKQISLSTLGDNIGPSKDPYKAFEGPLSAFRNYAGNHVAATGFSQLFLSAHPSESQLATPSLLLLDGSSIASTLINSQRDLPDWVVQSPIGQSMSTPSLEQSQESVCQSPRSSVVSIESLQARLPLRSLPMIKHIRSVLRCCSTDSLRSSSSRWSSWVSFRSQMSTKSSISIASSWVDEIPNESGRETEHYATRSSQERHHQRFVLLSASSASPDNRRMPINIRIKPPKTGVYNMILKRRGCDCIFTLGKYSAPNTLPILCNNCGLALAHLLAHLLALSLVGVNRSVDLHLDLNQRDYLDNTTLHFAAMAAQSDMEVFLKLIDMGAVVDSVTTSGETFLHILFRHLLWENVYKLCPLLQRLQNLHFPFYSRDYLGRQPFHILLGRHQAVPDFFPGPFSQLEEVFAIAKPDFDALSSAGHSIRSLLRASPGIEPYEYILERLLSSYPTSRNTTVDFEIKMKSLLSKANCDWSRLIEWLAIDHRAIWIDHQGNTALIALLKCWSYGQSELMLDDVIKQMVRLGSEIHMRDREGETALAIAVRRGLRSAVTTLIKFGASIHSTTLRGASILRNARKSLLQAKHNHDDKLYAMIWSCIIYLVDLKACESPSERRQRWATWAPDSHFCWEEKEERRADILQALVEEGFL